MKGASGFFFMRLCLFKEYKHKIKVNLTDLLIITMTIKFTRMTTDIHISICINVLYFHTIAQEKVQEKQVMFRIFDALLLDIQR
jgi:hypothetical protein